MRLYGYTREEARGRVSHELLGTEFEGGPITPVLNALERAGHWEGQLHHTLGMAGLSSSIPEWS